MSASNKLGKSFRRSYGGYLMRFFPQFAGNLTGVYQFIEDWAGDAIDHPMDFSVLEIGESRCECYDVEMDHDDPDCVDTAEVAYWPNEGRVAVKMFGPPFFGEGESLEEAIINGLGAAEAQAQED